MLCLYRKRITGVHGKKIMRVEHQRETKGEANTQTNNQRFQGGGEGNPEQNRVIEEKDSNTQRHETKERK